MIEYKVKVYKNKLGQEDGTEWCLPNGDLHREDGPAVEHADGYKEWYRNGLLHREDGPAVEYANGDKYWYLNGKQYTEQEFNAEMAERKSPCLGAIIEFNGKKYKLTEV